MHTTTNTDLLIRSEVWANEIKEILRDSLMAERYVRWLTDFNDGNQVTIPSIGDFGPPDNYTENEPIQYRALDTGEFTFNITEYNSFGTYITKKARQDVYYAQELESQFVPKMERSIRQNLEQHILKEGQPKTGAPGGYQTAGALNQINGAAHRWVGSDTVNSNKVIGLSDFSRANYALNKANVPFQNRIAIVDPSVQHHLETLTNIVNVSNNPRWEGVVTSGLGNDMQFLANIYNFDVYTSNYLPKSGVDQSGASETIDSVASGADAIGCLFFSASPDVIPFIGAWRQMPEVYASLF